MIHISELRTICPNCGETLIKDYRRMLCLSCGCYFGPDDQVQKKTAPHRTEKKIGIISKHHWTEEEKEIVRTGYKGTKESMREIVNKIWQELGVKVTLLAVRCQVHTMGLCKETGRKSWDESQDGRLRELAGKYAVITIARKMNRSISSVVNRLKELEIYRRECRNGWYTKKAVCEILGIDHKMIQQFIDLGMLRASYHHEHKPSQRDGARTWHIEEEAVASFIRRHPEELTGRNVDLIQIVQILNRSNNGRLSPM